MNQDKAREFFSAYYEGTLEGGLRQQLEAKLRTDADLKADYAAFVETMESLNDLRFEEIDVPIYLNDRIATRLEAEEAKRKQPLFAFGQWLKGASLVGLAAASIAAAVFAMQGNAEGPATAGLVAGPGGSNLPFDRLAFSAEGRDVRVHFRAAGAQTVTVSAAQSGKTVKRFHLDGDTLNAPLNNPHATPAVLTVTATAGETALVALPGTSRQTATSGTGSLRDFAANLAGRYGVPVIVRGPETRDVIWQFDATSARVAAETALAGTASVDQRDGGLVTILVR